MSTQAPNIETTDSKSYSYVFRQNVSVGLSNGGLIRCNIYLPKTGDNGRYPALITYGPYGKDIPYKQYVGRLHRSISRAEPDLVLIPLAMPT